MSCLHIGYRETVRMMSDGGHVCLDWYNELDPSQPTLVILPGLVGERTLFVRGERCMTEANE